MSRRLDRATLAIYWGSLTLGLVLPWLLDLGVHGPGLRRRPFAPGYNVFLIGVLDAVPFTAYAVFALLHLGTADRRGAVVAARRLGGVAGAGLAILAAGLWLHAAILTSRSSTAALGYIFLPAELLAAIPLGYAVGRLGVSRLGRRPTRAAKRAGPRAVQAVDQGGPGCEFAWLDCCSCSWPSPGRRPPASWYPPTESTRPRRRPPSMRHGRAAGSGSTTTGNAASPSEGG